MPEICRFYGIVVDEHLCEVALVSEIREQSGRFIADRRREVDLPWFPRRERQAQPVPAEVFHGDNVRKQIHR
ncbi:MAG TPA: hypothetical protein VFK32_03595, partial [Tepidiformaceae bacterium]|nr:hypothetical protein [Tepidiformaceae bacterium]